MTELKRTLTARDLTLLVVGTVIGSGIFVSPGSVLREVGNGIGPALLVWLVGGVLSLLGALTYGEMSAMRPQAGGLYVYIRDCFGRFPAFMFGWTLFFVISSGTNATLAVAFSNYLGAIVPLGPVQGKAVSVAVLIVLMAINLRGTRGSADLQNWTTAIKVLAILVMSALLLSLGNGFAHADNRVWPPLAGGSLATGFGAAMISVLWAYEGWQYATFSAGETVDPQRSFPRAFLVGMAILIFVYLLANVAYLAALGAAGVAGTNSVAADSMAALLGPTAATLITIPILISIFSAANSTLLTAPRVFYAMAQDGLFFRRLAEVHPRFGTPALAIVVSSVWAMLLAITGTFEQLLTYVVFIGWMFYGLAGACIFVYRRRVGDAERPYKTPGYPYTPILFIASAMAIVVNTIASQPVESAVGLAIVLIGAPAYLVWRARGSRATP